jgi:NAD(P)-dependent dehydrogenase (short-subunit alcohol dehydrogenase family)
MGIRVDAGSSKHPIGLVTGAASGIGRASARLQASRGAWVAVADIDATGGQETVDLIEKAGGEAEFVDCDVSVPEQVEALVAGVVAREGRLDFAHNNVGVLAERPASIDQIDDESWRRVVDVNFVGTWLCLRHELAVMRKQGYGAVVNTASVCGEQVTAGACPYNATKHAVIGLTKEAAVDFAELGVRINAVCPGYVDTPLTRRNTTAADRRRILDSMPAPRFATAEEIAEAVAWLLSDSASYVTGHSLVVDGGLAVSIPAPE